MPDLIGEAEAIARIIVRRENLPADLAADLLREAVRDGRINVHRELQPGIYHNDSSPFPGGFAVYEDDPVFGALVAPRYSIAEIDALIAGLVRPSQPSRQEDDPVQVSSGKLEKFLAGFANGERTQAECKAAAEAHFGAKIPDKNLWRPAWQQVPQEQRLKRGQRRSSNTAK